MIETVRIKVCLSDALPPQSDFKTCEDWFQAEEQVNGPIKFVIGRSAEDDEDEHGLKVLRLLILPWTIAHVKQAERNYIYKLNSAGFLACIGTKPDTYGYSESLSGNFPHTCEANKASKDIVSEAFSAWPTLETFTIQINDEVKEIKGDKHSPNVTSFREVMLKDPYDRCGRKRSWAARRLAKSTSKK